MFGIIHCTCKNKITGTRHITSSYQEHCYKTTERQRNTKQKWDSWLQNLLFGCVRLAPLGRPWCVAFFFSRTNVGNYLHTFVLEKKPVTRRGRPREAKRTHPLLVVYGVRWDVPGDPNLEQAKHLQLFITRKSNSKNALPVVFCSLGSGIHEELPWRRPAQGAWLSSKWDDAVIWASLISPTPTPSGNKHSSSEIINDYTGFHSRQWTLLVITQKKINSIKIYLVTSSAEMLIVWHTVRNSSLWIVT